MPRHTIVKTSNDGIPHEITLKKVTAYRVYASDDERSGSIKGHYSTSIVAEKKAEKAGWWGSDGEVQQVTLHTDGKYLYEVRNVGQYVDVAEGERKQMLENITQKLSSEEMLWLTKNGANFTEIG